VRLKVLVLFDIELKMRIASIRLLTFVVRFVAGFVGTVATFLATLFLMIQGVIAAS
jgi:hypothetical protein